MTPWDDKGKDSLILFTVAEYDKLPDGIELESISGDIKVKGKDYIDLDTRFGHIAWGVRDPLNHKDKHVVLMAVLAAKEGEASA